MNYCPYCAEPLSKPTKVCPYCKKSLDFDLLKSIIEPTESSDINRKMLFKRWFKEHSFIIYPLIALIIGFIAGGILLYGYAQIEFAGQKSEYETTITELRTTIENKDAQAGDVQSELQATIKRKDQIIQTLMEQKDIYSRMIYFTSRFSENSTITANSAEDSDYYRRNTLYLIRLFEEAQKKLEENNFKDDKNYNVRSIPSLLQ